MSKKNGNKPKIVKMKKSNEAIEKEYHDSIIAFENYNAALELMIAGIKVYAIQYPYDKQMAYGSHQAVLYINNLMTQTARAIAAQRELLGKEYVSPEDTVALFRILLKEERGIDDATLDFLQHHYNKPEDNIRDAKNPLITKLTDEQAEKLLEKELDHGLHSHYEQEYQKYLKKQGNSADFSKQLEGINKLIAKNIKKDKDDDESV